MVPTARAVASDATRVSAVVARCASSDRCVVFHDHAVLQLESNEVRREKLLEQAMEALHAKLRSLTESLEG